MNPNVKDHLKPTRRPHPLRRQTAYPPLHYLEVDLRA